VFFYEQEFYGLSNFSAFPVMFDGTRFSTSEHAYHWAKFNTDPILQVKFEHFNFSSAHEAFQLAQANKAVRRSDWDLIKFEVMTKILWAKAHQNEYVMTKLLETGDRELVEDSWRDDVWGWGPNRNGQNLLGKAWTEVRTHIENHTTPFPDEDANLKFGSTLNLRYAATSW
jgi:ribA/ribD-fused uncharacterized protein